MATPLNKSLPSTSCFFRHQVFNWLAFLEFLGTAVETWVCFLYQHLNEIEWMPAVEQVTSTLPHAFHDKHPTTFAISDGSKVFIETPSDLQMQSSTWSDYKHHNNMIVKFAPEWSSLLHLAAEYMLVYFRCGAHASVRFYSETGRYGVEYQ